MDTRDPVAAWRAQARRRRIRSALVAAAGAVLALLGLGALAQPIASHPAAGEPVSGAVVVYSPAYRVSFFGIEHLHPFDIRKYDRIADALVESGRIERDQLRSPEPLADGALLSAHTPEYLDSLRDRAVLSRALEVGVPRIFPYWIVDNKVLQPMRNAVAGTVEAARAARDVGVGINLGGGFHHARPELGHGFCVYNDVAVAAADLRAGGLEGPILIVDTDAHQGDGNHAAFADDASVYTFSMHQGDAFPIPKVPGDRDVSLSRGTDDERFLALLDQHLGPLMDELQPAIVFHVAGVDVLSDDPLTDLGMTIDGVVSRDLAVLEAARSRQIPLVHLLAGGYGPSAAEAQTRSVGAILDTMSAGSGR